MLVYVRLGYIGLDFVHLYEVRFRERERKLRYLQILGTQGWLSLS